MEFLKNLFGGFSMKPEKKYYVFAVRCKRCGEVIEGRVDVYNDPSLEYENDKPVYYCRKVLMGDGSNRCYQQIEVGLKFDAAKNVIDRTISGGAFAEDED